MRRRWSPEDTTIYSSDSSVKILRPTKTVQLPPRQKISVPAPQHMDGWMESSVSSRKSGDNCLAQKRHSCCTSAPWTWANVSLGCAVGRSLIIEACTLRDEAKIRLPKIADGLAKEEK